MVSLLNLIFLTMQPYSSKCKMKSIGMSFLSMSVFKLLSYVIILLAWILGVVSKQQDCSMAESGTPPLWKIPEPVDE